MSTDRIHFQDVDKKLYVGSYMENGKRIKFKYYKNSLNQMVTVNNEIIEKHADLNPKKDK